MAIEYQHGHLDSRSPKRRRLWLLSKLESAAWAYCCCCCCCCCYRWEGMASVLGHEEEEKAEVVEKEVEALSSRAAAAAV